MTTPTDASAFIARWQNVSACKLSSSQSFVIGLCELLGVPRPHATPEQDYMFERPVTFQHGDGSTSAGEVLRMLQTDGWYLAAQRGSHRQFKSQSKVGRVTLPGKPSDDLAPGTTNSTRKQAGLK